jgi:hypothetical protein
MMSINITVTHNEFDHNLDVTDVPPFTVSAWYIDRADGLLVTADREGINPVNLVGEVLADLNRQRNKLLEVS